MQRAGVVGKALKRLQDAIGDWHDWLLLAEEAHHYLDKDGAGLRPRSSGCVTATLRWR